MKIEDGAKIKHVLETYRDFTLLKTKDRKVFLGEYLEICNKEREENNPKSRDVMASLPLLTAAIFVFLIGLNLVFLYPGVFMGE